MASLIREPLRSVSFRPVIWLFHLALPLAGLWLLLGNPGLDITWQDHVGHFWIVLVTALISLALAILVARSAQRHAEARLYLIALGFATAASFLALHAYATPAVVVTEHHATFNLATPIGVAIAGAFAAAAALDITPQRADWVLARRGPLALLVAALLGGWAIASLAPGTPLEQLSPATIRAWIGVVAVIGIGLYAIAIVRSISRYRRGRSSVVLLSIITAQVLLAQSLVAMAVAPNWHLSWWLWHILMAIAFAYIAYAAHVQYRREGATTTLFTSIVADETLERLRDEYAGALDQLVAAIEAAGAEAAGAEAASDDAIAMRDTVERLRHRIGLSEGQAEVLEEAAGTLAAERLEGRRLAALVQLGRQARVALDEDSLIRQAEDGLGAAFPGDEIVIVRTEDDRLERVGGVPAATAVSSGTTSLGRDGAREVLAIPLRSGEQVLGVLVARRSTGAFSTRATGILESAANQLAVVFENGRLFRQIERLFRAYLSPDVARTLLADPALSGLGGTSREVTVLFADLRGYTAFSAKADPASVVALLNRYFGAIVPIILAEGGTVTQFMGDALMAIFNAPAPQADHPLRAARAALAIQSVVEATAAEIDGDPPRFRIGIETGPVVVGNIGAAEVRSFTAIGETTNLAARLQTYALAGRIVVGPTAARLLGATARLRRIGAVELKGFPEAVEAYVLEGLAQEDAEGPAAAEVDAEGPADGPASPA